MSKLVDRERLAKLAKALDQRAKDFANGLDTQVRADFKAQDDVLAERISTLEGLVVGGEGEGLEAVIGDVAQNKADIAVLMGEEEGSVKKAVADLQAIHDQEMDAVENKVAALEAFQEGHDHALIESDIDGLEQAIADMDAAYKAADVQGLADAKAYADEKIAALVNSAPEAMDTLQELAKAIQDNKDVYDAYIAEHAQAMANLKAELQAEIDADVKAEADRAVAEEAKIREEMAEAVAGVHGHENKEVLDGINAEKIAAWDGAQAGAEAKAAELDAALKAEMQAEIDADVKIVADDLALEKAKIVALQEFQAGHSHEAIEQEMAANKQACEDAMAQEVIDRNQAIADALEPFANEEEVKAMLTEVISSLDLSIADDKVILKLGKEENGFVLAEQSLDLATDADIDAIIAGLDEEE